jgi:hypothetical protein
MYVRDGIHLLGNYCRSDFQKGFMLMAKKSKFSTVQKSERLLIL